MSPEELAVQHFHALATGSLDQARSCLHPGHVNHMAADEPPACALPGAAGFLATSAWLRMAFSQLTFEVIDTVSDSRQTMAHVWMRGRQTGPFVVFPPGAKPVVFPPTGREFAVRHCHVFRLREGLHGEHIAVRDDLGMMTQLGHLPPSPAVAARMARWALTGQARRAIAQAVTVSAAAAADTAAAATASPAQGSEATA